MKYFTRLSLAMVFFIMTCHLCAERVKVQKVMIIGSNVQFIYTLNKKSKFYYALPGFHAEVGETKMGILNRGKYKKDKVSKMWFDTNDEQVYLSLKKTGKKRLNEIEFLQKYYLRPSVISGYIGMGITSIGLFFTLNGVFEDSNAQIGIGFGLIAFSVIPYIITGMGEYTNLELPTCDIFYQLEGEDEYHLFQKAPKDAGTFPHNLNDLKIK